MSTANKKHAQQEKQQQHQQEQEEEEEDEVESNPNHEVPPNENEPRDNGSDVMDVDLADKKMRSIGRWFIGDTLGKGGYSWVKRGFDKKTGKCVALKFMAKADDTWSEEQSKQVVTEIEALKQIRHPHVMKLYAYNLNAKYPTKGNEKIETILLVLEFAPGGELFDILYYTSALEPIVARTYFRQMIAGLEACHNAGVAHRDIKPQNLLLDSRFNLKITDFGLSKVFESDADAVMKTTYVGTRGYQAPELLLDKAYDLSCDIFSAGVVLFILLTGYPPFEQAHTSDRWFKPLAKGDYDKFWNYHKGCSIANDAKVKDLLQRMLVFDPKKRISIADIKKHPWYLDKTLDGKELIRALRNRHRDMESKRRKDAKKLVDLQQSINNRGLPCPACEKQDCSCIKVPMYPENEVESVIDTHTTSSFKDIFNYVIQATGKDGSVVFDPSEARLTCAFRTVSDVSQQTYLIKFDFQLFKSREYQNPKNSPNDEEKEETVYVVRMKRLEGDIGQYRKVKKYIFDQCSGILTGLPEWALEIQQKKLNELEKQNENEDENESDDAFEIDNDQSDNYDEILAKEGFQADNELEVVA